MQRRVEVCEEGIQRCEPGANTLDFVVEAFQPVVGRLSRVKHLDLKHWTHSGLIGSQFRRKYVKAAGIFIYLSAAH